jgi:hypothetical protein
LSEASSDWVSDASIIEEKTGRSLLDYPNDQEDGECESPPNHLFYRPNKPKLIIKNELYRVAYHIKDFAAATALEEKVSRSLNKTVEWIEVLNHESLLNSISLDAKERGGQVLHYSKLPLLILSDQPL